MSHLQPLPVHGERRYLLRCSLWSAVATPPPFQNSTPPHSHTNEVRPLLRSDLPNSPHSAPNKLHRSIWWHRLVLPVFGLASSPPPPAFLIPLCACFPASS